MGLILNRDFTEEADFPVESLLSIETEVERRARHQRNEQDYYWDRQRREQLEEDRWKYDITDRSLVG